MNKYILALFIVLATLSSCIKDNSHGSSPTYGSVLDIDNNLYHTIKIGTQTWTQENLKTTHYRNGDSIPNITDVIQWENNITGAYCNYNNDSGNGNTYGHLYNWYSINNPAGLCPPGWHIPSDSEWDILINYLGGQSTAGGAMKAVSQWNMPNTDANNISGLTIFPGGGRSQSAIFGDIGYHGAFWSSTGNDSTTALYLNVNFDNSQVYHYFYPKLAGFSSRCVKD